MIPIRIALVAALALPGGPAFAETAPADLPVALRAIPARTVISAEDISPGADGYGAQAVIGQEALRLIPRGRPIRPGDVGPRTLVDRNQTVALIFARAGLRIETAGRALDRGAAGALVRVMNLGSRQTVTGRVGADGTVTVSDPF